MSAVDVMPEPEILARTRALLDEHEVEGFGVAMSGRMTRALGLCDFRKREIRISRKLAERNDRAVIDDVIRHEVAHALAGPGAGHGPRWKDACRVTGATPRSCVDAREIVTVPRDYRFKGECEACGQPVGQRRKAPDPLVNYTHVAKYCEAGGGKVRWTDTKGARA